MSPSFLGALLGNIFTEGNSFFRRAIRPYDSFPIERSDKRGVEWLNTCKLARLNGSLDKCLFSNSLEQGEIERRKKAVPFFIYSTPLFPLWTSNVISSHDRVH